MAIYPKPEQIQELLKGPPDQPVVMINLLQFKAKADGQNEGKTGQAAYLLYAEQMRKVVESHGGRFIWAGRVDSVVIGDGEPGFQVVALVEYPSRQTFIEVASSERVREIGTDRASGLESQWLIASTTGGLGQAGEPTGG